MAFMGEADRRDESSQDSLLKECGGCGNGVATDIRICPRCGEEMCEKCQGEDSDWCAECAPSWDDNERMCGYPGDFEDNLDDCE